MEYKNLGNSGLKVSKIILGAMGFGIKGYMGQSWLLDDEDYIMSILKTAYDSGIRTFDTANQYSDGESEIFIGKFLKKYNINRSTVVIMSKIFMPCWGDDKELERTEMNLTNRWGLSRKHIFDAVDASVERLGTHLDVLQISRFDPDTPIEETMKALNDVVQSGKARYLGASTMRPTEFARLQFTAEKHGWTKFISMQNQYNLLYREEERDMIPYCNETGVALIPWSPIARGALARPVSEVTERSKVDMFIKSGGLNKPQNHEIISRVEKVANDKGISMAMIAIAWNIAKGTCPIIGFNKPERVDEAVKALKVKLTQQEIEYLEEPYLPQEVTGGVNKAIIMRMLSIK